MLTTIAWVGGLTAFLSACFAFTETDLKRILAFSTLSQLGYMVMALGLGGPTAGMYHLTTHAFFKALLFLSAGSVIHGTHEQGQQSGLDVVEALQESQGRTDPVFANGEMRCDEAAGIRLRIGNPVRWCSSSATTTHTSLSTSTRRTERGTATT